MLDFFKSRKKKVKDFQGAVRLRTSEEVTAQIPDGLYEKCPKCDGNTLASDLKIARFVCPSCGYHFRLTARQRLEITVDDGTFEEMNRDLKSTNPLDMPGYQEKLDELYEDGLQEAIVTGIGKIDGYRWAIAVMDSTFLMGSMGTVVGEKIVKLIEHATKDKLPLVIFSTSGGARMQEGALSLVQMAKTTAALGKHDKAGLLYVSVLTDPTFGGVSASFATVADVILAEPEALIGFAGPRVIKQTIKQVLPAGFQSSEFLLEHGFVDRIVLRSDLNEVFKRLSKTFHAQGGEAS